MTPAPAAPSPGELKVARSQAAAAGPLGAQFTARFDRNGDGRLGLDEWEAAEKTLRTELPKIPPFLRRWDRNGDGAIDDTEWSAARAEQRRRMAAER